MINKEILKAAFKDFNVHYCKFTDYEFYLINGYNFSFHISIYPGEKEPIIVETYSNSQLVSSQLLDDQNLVILSLQGSIEDYKTDTGRRMYKLRINRDDIERRKTGLD